MIFKIVKSPNFTKKPRNIEFIKFIIIHYTGMQSKRASVKRLCSKKYKVSCHYLIDRGGEITQLVEENKIAWHAGKSKWKKFINLNKFSIGIELVNKGHMHGYQNFTPSQIKKLILLCAHLKKKYNIRAENILGHSDIAPKRKKDPGEKFPWKLMGKKKLGLLSNSGKKNLTSKKTTITRNKFFSNLSKIGYKYFSIKKSNVNDRQIIRAFQRRFLQNRVTGKIDQKTFTISQYIAGNI
jgi:N-acetylmuramoyl-L-alanine amidase